MFKSILFPTDFSPESRMAQPILHTLLQKTGAHLHLVHAYDVSDMTPAHFPPISDPAEQPLQQLQKKVEKDEVALSESRMKKIAEELELQEGQYNCVQAKAEPADVILDVAHDQNTGLIISGTKGRESDNHWRSSLTSLLMRKAHCPVLHIPLNSKVKSIKKIVFASELNDSDISYFKYVCQLAELLNAQVTLLHLSTSAESGIQRKKHQYFDTVDYSQVSFDHRDVRNLQTGLTDYIEYNHTDLLCMSTHNHSWIDDFFHRSLASEISQLSKIPLLTAGIFNQSLLIS